MPLPLLSKDRSVEFVAFNGVLNWISLAHIGFLMFHHRLSAIVASLRRTGSLLSHNRPVVFPRYRLQPYHTPIGFLVLEMQEPVFPTLQMNPSALMRTIDISFTYSQHALALIRAVRTLGTHGQLMPYRHSPGRTHDPIPSVTLIKLRTFCRAVFRTITVKDDDRITYLFHAVCRHFPNRQNGIKLTAGICPSIHQVAFPVLIPKRRCINHSLAWDDAFGRGPFTLRIFCRSHENAKVRVSPIYIIGTIKLIITDARSPHAITMLRLIIALQRRKGFHGIVHNLPVHQIL